MRYKVIHKKITDKTNYPAMAPPNYKLIEREYLITEVPVRLGETVYGLKVIQVEYTNSGVTLTIN